MSSDRVARLGLLVASAAIVWLAVLAVCSGPAEGHTERQRDAWLEEWSSRAADGLTLELAAELADFLERHETRRRTRRPPRTVPAGVERWRPAVAAAFPSRLVDEALSVMWCESRGNPAAKNAHSSAAGLFQFLRSTWDRIGRDDLGFGSYASGDVYVAELNIAAAAELVRQYEERGFWRWAAWECQP